MENFSQSKRKFGLTHQAQNPAVLFVLVCVVVIAGTLFRIQLVDETRQTHTDSADAQQYFLYAYNLSNTGIYSRSKAFLNRNEVPTPDAERPPLFSLLASIWLDRQSDEQLKQVLNVNLYLQVAGLLLFTIIAVKTWTSLWVLIPILFLWFNPHFAIVVTYLLTESLFTALLLFALFALWRYERESMPIYLGLFGLFLGLSAITRGTTEYFWIILLLAVVVFRSSDWKQFFTFLIPFAIPNFDLEDLGFAECSE